MLINNLSKHRSKYSLQKNQKLYSYRPASLNVIPKSCSKTEKRSTATRHSAHNIASKYVFLENNSSQSMIKSTTSFYNGRSAIGKLSINLGSEPHKNQISKLQKNLQKKPQNFFKQQADSIFNPQKENKSKRSEIYLCTQQHQVNETERQPKSFKRKIAQKKLKPNKSQINKSMAHLDQSECLSTFTNSSNLKSTNTIHQIFKKQKTTNASTRSSNFLSASSKNVKQDEKQYIRIIIDAPSVQNQQMHLKNLKFHQVFFCKLCFRYIFVVEKYYHYPKCQNALELDKLESHERYMIGLSKINMLKQLAEYTSTKIDKIKLLCELVNSEQLKRKGYQNLVEYNGDLQTEQFDKRKYLSLNQIDIAFDLIYKKLLSEQLQKKITTKSYLLKNQKLFCKAVGVDQINQVQLINPNS